MLQSPALDKVPVNVFPRFSLLLFAIGPRLQFRLRIQDLIDLLIHFMPWKVLIYQLSLLVLVVKVTPVYYILLAAFPNESCNG